MDEICTNIVDEAMRTIGVRTAAVLFCDESGQTLMTKAAKGTWDGEIAFPRGEGVIWRSIEAKRPSAFCRFRETEFAGSIPNISSLMVCPILGKVKAVGAIVVADKEDGEEFYSHDTKLLMAISTQAGLAIENAFLYSELESLLLGAIRSLVKALEATSYWTAGHTERVTEYAVAIGRCMDLQPDLLDKLKVCALLHDIGKIATPKEILNKCTKLEEHEWLEIKKHPGIGAEILEELRQFKDVILGIKYHHEHWDGRKGIFGLRGIEIPLMARILAVADAFDALTSDRPYRTRKSRDEAIAEIVRCAGTQFDPEVVDAFRSWVGVVS